MTGSAEVGEIITATTYCRPITAESELRSLQYQLHSRTASSSASGALCRIGVVTALDRYLSATQGGRPPHEEETGRRLFFLQVLAGRYNQVHDGTPLIITTLHPDLAFNLSEVEEAYGFASETLLREYFGDSLVDHLVVFEESLYLDTVATCILLLHEDPVLLLSLVHSIIIKDQELSLKIREVLRGAAEALRGIEIEDNASLIQTLRTSVVFDCQSAVSQLLTTSEDHTQWYVLHLINQAYEFILTETLAAFEKQYNRLLEFSTRSEEDMEVDGDLPQVDDSTENIERLYRSIRNASRRLNRLSHVIPMPW